MKIEEMTEEQILYEALKAIPEYMERIKPDGDFNRQVCAEMAVNNLRSLFKSSRGIGYFDKMMVQDIKELDRIIRHFYPTITDRVAAVEMQYKKELMELAINKAKAEAIIIPAFERAGFKVKVEYLDHIALVSVRLIGKKWAQFQVRYKDINGDGCLDDLVAAVVDLKDAAIRIGSNLFIGRQ